MSCFNQISLASAVKAGSIEWSKHAIQRMHQRGVTRHEVTALMSQCRIVNEYPDDTPFPSALLESAPSAMPLHAVVAYDETQKQTFVITVFRPNPAPTPKN